MRNYLYATRSLTVQQTTLEQRILFLAALTVNGVVAVREPIEKCIALALENSWQGATILVENQVQVQLLGATYEMLSGGPAQTHVGTGGGGSSSDMPWGEKKNGSNTTTSRRKR